MRASLALIIAAIAVAGCKPKKKVLNQQKAIIGERGERLAFVGVRNAFASDRFKNDKHPASERVYRFSQAGYLVLAECPDQASYEELIEFGSGMNGVEVKLDAKRSLYLVDSTTPRPSKCSVAPSRFMSLDVLISYFRMIEDYWSPDNADLQGSVLNQHGMLGLQSLFLALRGPTGPDDSKPALVEGKNIALFVEKMVEFQKGRRTSLVGPLLNLDSSLNPCAGGPSNSFACDRSRSDSLGYYPFIDQDLSIKPDATSPILRGYQAMRFILGALIGELHATEYHALYGDPADEESRVEAHLLEIFSSPLPWGQHKGAVGRTVDALLSGNLAYFQEHLGDKRGTRFIEAFAPEVEDGGAGFAGAEGGMSLRAKLGSPEYLNDLKKREEAVATLRKAAGERRTKRIEAVEDARVEAMKQYWTTMGSALANAQIQAWTAMQEQRRAMMNPTQAMNDVLAQVNGVAPTRATPNRTAQAGSGFTRYVPGMYGNSYSQRGFRSSSIPRYGGGFGTFALTQGSAFRHLDDKTVSAMGKLSGRSGPNSFGSIPLPQPGQLDSPIAHPSSKDHLVVPGLLDIERREGSKQLQWNGLTFFIGRE